MELYTMEVNYLNHSNFKASELFCFECEELLTGTIYSRENINLCGNSKETTVKDPTLVVNSFLKQQLAVTQFPCKYYQCDYKGLLSEYIAHLDECYYGLLVCPLDNKKIEGFASFSKHLLVHPEIQTVTVDSLSMLIELDLKKLEKKIMLTNYKNHYFLVIVQISKETVTFAVGHHMISGSPLLDNFKVVHDDGNTFPTQSGKILPLTILLNADNDALQTITFKTSVLSSAPKFVVYFSDYELRKTEVLECPICMIALLGNIRSCVNGHYVCASCGSKIKACAICKAALNGTFTYLQHLLPNLSFPCVNYEEGCAELIKLKDRSEHNQLCVFRKHLCNLCKTECRQYNFFAHLKEIHTPSENFTTFSWSFQSEQEITRTVVILYRAHVFYLTTKYNTNSVLEFYVEAIEGCKNLARKFRYEVLLLNTNDKVVATCGNTCINVSNDPKEIEEYNSNFKLNPCRNEFFASDTWTVRCQVNILYNY